MATNIDFDLNAWFASAQEQFSGLNPNEPGQWPWLPKAAAFLAVCLAALGLGWFLLISDQVDQLEAAREREPVLKADYKDKLAQAPGFDKSSWPSMADADWVRRVHAFYGTPGGGT